MRERFEVRTTRQWKALSHPLRVHVLRLLQDQPLTNEELAKRLGVESGKLYYHTKHLLNSGLIELVETRAKGPITEKVYRALAKSYVAVEMPDPAEAVSPPFEGWITNAMWVYRQSWKNDPEAVQQQSAGYHFLVHLTPEKAGEFSRQVTKLAFEFEQADRADPTLPRYSLGMIFNRVIENEPEPVDDTKPGQTDDGA
jgi:DNA-binding transcriptional ArsR family regulator